MHDTNPGFEHRLLLGWINDNSSVPLAGKRWPIIDVGERTIADYGEYLRIARQYGYAGITLWGLCVSHAWPVPLQDCLTPDRRRVIDFILRESERLGIKVLMGLGVYSWGFEQIIRHDPSTARDEGRMSWGKFRPDNGVVMCYHSPSARDWMRKVIDFCVTEVGTHGFGFQSGDQGRCYCRQCREISDMEHHARLIGETAAYVRDRYPEQLLGMSAWGIDLGKDSDLEMLKRMSRQLCFMTDVTDQLARAGEGFRRSLVEQLPCALGSLGGTVVVPPQRWERDRWFLPHAALTARSIQALYADGGRAFEFFMGPLANPQYNLMTRFVGLMLRNPRQEFRIALRQVVEDVYSPRSSVAADDIVQWLLDAEQAYFARIPGPITGEFDFEPLMGETAGEPIYLTRLSKEALREYEQDMERLAGRLPGLASECARPEELHKIGRCLRNVVDDIRHRLVAMV